MQMRKEKSDKASSNVLVIDITTLKKLLNKASCEFLLGLIQGTNEKDKEKGE